MDRGACWSTGSQSIKALGLGEAVAKASIYSQSHVVFDNTGRLLGFWGARFDTQLQQRQRLERPPPERCDSSHRLADVSVEDPAHASAPDGDGGGGGGGNGGETSSPKSLGARRCVQPTYHAIACSGLDHWTVSSKPPCPYHWYGRRLNRR